MSLHLAIYHLDALCDVYPIALAKGAVTHSFPTGNGIILSCPELHATPANTDERRVESFSAVTIPSFQTDAM